MGRKKRMSRAIRLLYFFVGGIFVPWVAWVSVSHTTFTLLAAYAEHLMLLIFFLYGIGTLVCIGMGVRRYVGSAHVARQQTKSLLLNIIGARSLPGRIFHSLLVSIVWFVFMGYMIIYAAGNTYAFLLDGLGTRQVEVVDSVSFMIHPSDILFVKSGGLCIYYMHLKMQNADYLVTCGYLYSSDLQLLLAGNKNTQGTFRLVVLPHSKTILSATREVLQVK